MILRVANRQDKLRENRLPDGELLISNVELRYRGRPIGGVTTTIVSLLSSGGRLLSSWETHPRPATRGGVSTAVRLKQACSSAWHRVKVWLHHLTGKWRRQVAISGMLEGDVLLASPRTVRLSPIPMIHRLVLGSRYVHSMLYVGAGQILHTTTRKGVTIDRVPSKVYEPRRYALHRVPHLTQRQRQDVVAAALRRKNQKLDRAALVTNIPAKLLGLRKPLISFEKNRLWCSKLIYDAYAEAGIELLSSEESGNVTSDDLARSTVLERIYLNV